MDILIDDIFFAPKPQVYTLQLSVPTLNPHVRDKGKRPMWALQQDEATKHFTYAALCTPSSFLREGLELHPIVFQIYGSIGTSAEKGLNPLFEFISTKKETPQTTKDKQY